jgi:Spy/CpxP family protein refolding chaperone
MNRKALALIASAMFAAAPLFAHDTAACCAGMAGKDMKGACNATFANLSLTPTQKSKMEKLAADCEKGGCNEKTMAKMEKGARTILNKEQFAAWKAACTGHSAHGSQKTQS